MDEILKMITVETAKQAAQRKSLMSYDELVKTIKKDTIKMVEYIKMQFEQFVAVGFTEEQAKDLTIAILK